MKTQPQAKTHRTKTPARTEVRGNVVYVAYQGNSPLSLPAPGQGFSYVFEPLPAKNRIEKPAWDELEDRKGPGSARPYIDARKLRKTGRPEFGDRVNDVRKTPIVKAELPQVTASADASNAAVIARLEATVARLSASNEQLIAEIAATKKAERPASEEDEGIDPSKLSIPKLTEALEGLDVDDLEAIKAREEAGKNRPKALAAIEAAIDAALGADSENEKG